MGKGTGRETLPGGGQFGAAGLRFSHDFPDGPWSTLAVIEAAEGAPWTNPGDPPPGPDTPLPKISGIFKDRVNVLMFDGSLRTIDANVPAAALKAAITRAGGERLPPEWDPPPR